MIRAALFLAALCTTTSGLSAQSPQVTSALVQPALDRLAAAGSAVDLNKWKGSSNARAEVDANLASMQKDLLTTLPPLLAAADGAPGSPSASLPVLLNLDALYSVLLRVTIASRTGAPREENAALEQAATWMDGARRDLGNQILAQTQAMEKHAHDLQSATSTQSASMPSAPALPIAAPAPRKKTAAKRKPASSKAAAPAGAPKPQ